MYEDGRLLHDRLVALLRVLAGCVKEEAARDGHADFIVVGACGDQVQLVPARKRFIHFALEKMHLVFETSAPKESPLKTKSILMLL